jgi:sulfotransferase family protein
MTLHVIGVGLGRTGTLSLKLALEKLGLGPCYHMAELMMHPERTPLWIAAADGKPDWEAIFAGYSSTTDYPACLYWRELANAYPKAKLILTKRDKQKWFESTQATIFSEAMSARIRGTPIEPFFEKTVWRDFGARIHDRAFMTAYFDDHNAAVEAGVAKKRLLVYDVAQGWDPLCKFLGVPVPDAAFPKVNSREEMQARIAGPIDPNRFVEEVREHLRDAENKR